MTQITPMRGFVDNTTLYGDWDYFSSMAESLRLYLTEHHTIPTWNMMLCGGKPELANPQSWAYTWPSILAYVLPGNLVFIVVWSLFSLLGFGAMIALLRQLGSRWPEALMGALLYVVNGYFASHFNQGHVTFAFFHFIPLLMISALYGWDTLAAGCPPTMALIMMIILSFLFFSTALPHPLFYFYPAVMIFVLLMAGLRHAGRFQGQRLKALMILTVAHGLGVVLAAYKLWPIIVWQLTSPRKKVLAENLMPADVLTNTWRWIPDYHEVFAFHFTNQVWFAWEYNAYVGPLVWIFIAVGAMLWARQRKRHAPMPGDDKSHLLLLLCALACCGLGMSLPLGNASPLSPAQFFKYVPLLSGVRVFGRYQILLIFGLCLLAAWSGRFIFARVPTWIKNPSCATILSIVLVVGVCLPAMWQAAVLVTTVEYLESSSLNAMYPIHTTGGPPSFINQAYALKNNITHQSYLLRQGVWIANCYEPMSVTRRMENTKYQQALTDPAPDRLVRLAADGLTLHYDAKTTGRIATNFVGQPDFEYNVPTQLESDGRRSFVAEDLPDHQFSMRRPPTVEWQGVYISLSGVCAALLFILGVRFRTKQSLAPTAARHLRVD